MRHTAITSQLALGLAFLIGGAGAASAETFTVGRLQISRLWMPATPETAPAAPGYLTVTNAGSEPDRLITGSIVAARGFSVPGDGITVNPGETVTLQPGGSYLTFSSLRGPVEPGMEVQSILKFERAGPVVVKFTVEAPPAAPARTGSTGRRAR